MASGPELKEIALARIKSAEVLINAKDWDGAGNVLGFALECALKSVVCKTLNLLTYPENHKDEKINAFFMTHFLSRLLLVSGLSQTFSAAGKKEEFDNWSLFVAAYPGDWASLKYLPPAVSPFTPVKVPELFKYLYEDKDSIINVIDGKGLW